MDAEISLDNSDYPDRFLEGAVEVEVDAFIGVPERSFCAEGGWGCKF